MEYSYHFPNKEKWFILSVSKLNTNKNLVVVRYTDITNQKKAEQKPIENETKYRTLIENSQEIIFSINTNGEFIFTNQQCHSLLKYTMEEFPSLSLFDIISKDSLTSCKKHFYKVINENKTRNIKLVFISKQGKKIYVAGNSTPIIVNGVVKGIQSFFMNKTQEVINEKKFDKSEQRFKNLVDNINDAIIVKNKTGKITYFNKRFLDLLGYCEKDMGELRMKDYIDKKWYKKVKDYYSDLLIKEKMPDVFKYESKHKNGSLGWFEDKPSLLFDGDKIIDTQTVIRDITDIKTKDAELNNLIVELTNKNNEMMQFNYIVSHNLRAPIANIIGLSSLLDTENKLEEKESDKIIQHIKDLSLKMDVLVKDLSIVLNTKSNLNTKKEKVYFNKIIQSITETLEEQITKSQCKIITLIDQKATSIITIKSYLESILFNLISNAIKYRSLNRNLVVKITTKKTQKLLII